MNRSTIVCIILIHIAFSPAVRNQAVLAALDPAQADLPEIDGNAVLEHIKVLASDNFEGRAPGTRGEDLTVAYLESQFRKLALKPGNVDGTYIQKVPLVGITPDSKVSLIFRRENETKQLKYMDDFVAWTRHAVARTGLEDSPLIFVGYGVEAPEFDWDDYRDVDVRNKTLVMLINDPPVPDPADPTKLDPDVFGGDAMTYYGRWTYKYDIGGEKGAAGVLVVHETEAAGYPWSVVQGFGGERFNVAASGNDSSKPKIEAWIGLKQAEMLFAMAGQDFDALKKLAATRRFSPVPLDLTASLTLDNTMRSIESRNVLARLEGSDSELKDEYVIYTAHWDHLGVGKPVNGDSIYNGAIDNASGVAGIIEIAKAFKKVPVSPKRSILFLAVTAEEQGLLGSEFYATNPIYPLAKTVAVINIDELNMHGRTKDFSIIGLGNSDLDDFARHAAGQQGRVIIADPEPEKGFYYRSDHFSFAKEGVPALDPESGIDYIGKPAGFGFRIRDDYNANDYHKPSDDVKNDWDMSGAVEDLQLLCIVGRDVANSDSCPQWKEGAEFKAKREAQLEGAGASH
jgi:Zn-dependent M28 family amino/carboxypeptidase